MFVKLICYSFNSTDHVYCTETRPYNQGARLTAYELVHEKIPSTLICDSMVAALMKTRSISAGGVFIFLFKCSLLQLLL